MPEILQDHCGAMQDRDGRRLRAITRTYIRHNMGLLWNAVDNMGKG